MTDRAALGLRRLGRSDLAVSSLALGASNFGTRRNAAAVDRIVGAAFELGINFFDTADNYGDGASEIALGRALRSRRENAVLATKFGRGPLELSHGAASAIVEACELSLRRLGTDRIDLYQLHRPTEYLPFDDVFEAMARLRAAGKIRHAGCSNLSSAQLFDAACAADASAGFVSLQHEYNLISRAVEQSVVPAALGLGMNVLPYYALAAGFLTGKYHSHARPPEADRLSEAKFHERYLNADQFALLERVRDCARATGRTPLELALGWLSSRPGVAAVIVGASDVAQLKRNVDAVCAGLSEMELQAADAILDSP